MAPLHAGVPGEQDLRGIYARLPMAFEEARSMGAGADYVARGGGYSVALRDGNAHITLAERNRNGGRSSVTMRLLGRNRQAAACFDEKPTATTSYFIGDDPRAWHRGIPTGPRIRYDGVYQNVGLVYYGNQRELEFDFIVKPGGDPSQIHFTLDGAENVQLLASGDLSVVLDGGEILWKKPYVYQETPAGRRTVAASYEMAGDTIAFDLGRYDRELPLVIDPVVSYATYLGGSLNDRCSGIAVDKEGNAYVTGVTGSDDFPTTPGTIETGTHRTIYFVTKLDPTATRIIWSTYIGSRNEPSNPSPFDPAIAIDSALNICVVGGTNANDYPVMNALQGSNGGGTDAVVTRINPAGTQIIFSTYLGGTDAEVARTVAAASDGSICVGGLTYSEDNPATVGNNEGFPLARALQSDLGRDGRYTGPTDTNRSSDGFICRLPPDGASLLFSTYIGGGSDELVQAIALDRGNAIYATGATGSTDFPVTPGALYPALQPGPFPLPVLFDGFVTKMPADGNTLAYATYLGDDSPAEIGWDIAVDTAGNVVVARLKAALSLGGSVITTTLTRLNSGGTAELFATDVAMTVNALAVQTDGMIYAGFSTTSSTYIMRLRPNGTRDAQITIPGTSLLDITSDNRDTIYAAGFAGTGVTGFPTTPGVVGPQSKGRIEGTVMKIGFERETVEITLVAPIDSADAGDTVWLPIVVRNADSLPAAVTGFTATLRVAASVLYPASPLATGTVVGDERLVPITLTRPLAGDSIAGRLPFIVMLGLQDSSLLILENSRAVGGNASITEIPGRLKVGICREGGPRLFNGSARIGLKPAVPNPASSMATLEFLLTDPGAVRLHLVDAAGRLAATLVDEPLAAGTHHVPLNLSGLPPGYYSAVLRTAAGIAATPVVIQR